MEHLRSIHTITVLPLSCASRSLCVLSQGCLWPRCLIAAPAAKLSVLRAGGRAKDDADFKSMASEKCCSNARTDVSNDCRVPSWELLPGPQSIQLLECKSHQCGCCAALWYCRQIKEETRWVVHLSSPDVFLCSLQVADQDLVTAILCILLKGSKTWRLHMKNTAFD